LFSKIDVNGDNAHPLFKFLKKEQKSVLGEFYRTHLLSLNLFSEKPVFSGDIEWNFTKFLINRQGKLVGCYAPATEPKEMVKDIEKALKESSV
jgi:glutathione peroxidase